jgi:hypothetical protein
MGSRITGPRRWRGPSRLLLPTGAAALAAALLGGGGAPAAATPAAPPGYAALSAGEPTGLTLTPPRPPRAALGVSGGPTWPASPPEGTGGSWPVTSSIRRLTLGVPGVSAWIARSQAGGICVLVSDGQQVEGVGAVGATCSTPEGFGAGASLEVAEIPGMRGRVIEAGVEPDGVSAVHTTLADGTSATTAVSKNGWARNGTEPSAPGSEPTAIQGG